MPTRRIHNAGLTLIKSFESLSIKAYQDQVGIWTIGFGHTGPEVAKGMEITVTEASTLLERDLDNAEKGVDESLEVHVNDNQFAALVSLAFNIGLGNFHKSTLLRKLNAGDVEGAAEEFPEWCHAGGKVSLGLARRRAAEESLFRLPSGGEQQSLRP